tara:strand:+ start:325 stop:588 length:264 start_codon:yes stop_codon:yes gene_type:complete
MKVESSPIKFEKSVRAKEHVSVEGTLVVDGDAVIGNATSDKIGFFGATPVDQPATVADATGGSTTDAEARAAINAVIDRLQELGLIA